jgi:hypothetical protein
MAGYLSTTGALVGMVIIAIIVLNRNAAIGKIAGQVVQSTGEVAKLSTAGPNQ